MLLQRSTIVLCHALLQFPIKDLLAVLMFPTKAPLATCGSKQNIMSIPTQPSNTHNILYFQLISKLFHTGHVAAHVVLGCLLLRFGP
jgi:hypothetical protein